MMSSSRDRLLCLISCVGSSTGIASLNSGNDLGEVSFSAGTMALAGLMGIIGLTETVISALGITTWATFVFRGALYMWPADTFLIFIIAAVVEVPQSGQLSLNLGRQRPHFRQNGICSL